MKQARHLDLILQYSTSIRYIKGKDNCPADTLSRLVAITKCDFDCNALFFQLKQQNKYNFAKILTSNFNHNLWYETTSGYRLYVPTSFRKNIFDLIHNLAYSRFKSTTRQITTKIFG